MGPGKQCTAAVPFPGRITQSWSFSIFWPRNPTRHNAGLQQQSLIRCVSRANALSCFTAEPFGRFDRRRCSEPHSVCGRLACILELSLLDVLRNGNDGAVSPGNDVGCSWSRTLLF